MTVLAHQLEKEGKADYTRGRDFFDPQTCNTNTVVAGVGGIGSGTALLLSKMGFPYLTLIDPDVIETHNLPNQMFPYNWSPDLDNADVVVNSSVGMEKVETAQIVCEMFGTAEVIAIQKKVQEVPHLLRGVIITGFDTMKARSECWDLVRLNAGVDYLIDARVGGLDVVVYTIDPKDPEDVEFYEEWALFTDEEGVDNPCTARMVCDVSFLVASVIARNRRMLANNEKVERMIALNAKTYDKMVT